MLGFFRRKKLISATAVLLEDGRARMNAELGKARYNRYRGAEPLIELSATLELPDGQTKAGTIDAPLSLCVLLLPGVRVKVDVEESRTDFGTVSDTHADVLARNAQILQR